MRYSLTLFLICSGTLAFSQKYKNLFPHKISVHYADHNITAFTEPVNSRIIPQPDRFYSWYASGTISNTQGGYSGKPLNGSYADYYDNKNLREKGGFENGLKTGDWFAWNDQGILKEISHWKEGIRNGAYFKYDSLGHIRESGTYRLGKLNGKQVVFSGDKQTVTNYRKGKAVQKKEGTKKPGLAAKLVKKVENLFGKKNKNMKANAM